MLSRFGKTVSPQHGGEQIVPLRKIRTDRALCEPGALGNRVDAGSSEAQPPERSGRFDDPGPDLGRLPASRTSIL
jgi:hypothetical protein